MNVLIVDASRVFHHLMAVVEAAVLEPGRFRVKFADGLEGTVRFAPTAYRGVFAKLQSPEAFNLENSVV